MSERVPQSNRVFGIEFAILIGMLALLCLSGGLGVYLIRTGWIQVSVPLPAPEVFTPFAAATPVPGPAAQGIPTPLQLGSALSVTGDFVGNWQVEIEKIAVAEAIADPRDGTVTRANRRFALILLRITNMSGYAQSFPAVEIQVIDSEGNGYQPNAPASRAASAMYGIPALPNLPPNDTCSLVLAYDLPLDGATYYLVPAFVADPNGQGIVLNMPE